MLLRYALGAVQTAASAVRINVMQTLTPMAKTGLRAAEVHDFNFATHDAAAQGDLAACLSLCTTGDEAGAPGWQAT